ncbi:MAG: pectinesterase family protein [Dysgonomonas sp.]
MKNIVFCIILSAVFITAKAQNTNYTLSPANNSKEINIDTRLDITFNSKPTIGEKGFIRVYEKGTNRLVDVLDLSIPAGPSEPDMLRKKQADYTSVSYKYETTGFTNANMKAGTPSGTALRDTSDYQLTIIGGFTDGFRFYPVIIDGNKAKIYLHNNLLEYDKEYYVTIDKGVITTETNDFNGITEKDQWTFSTKTSPPPSNHRKLIVSADGSGNFNTLQGCMDAIPDFSKEKWVVYVKNGDYEELVYFRNKSNVVIKGESREGVIIHYANNETFNPHPINVKTNEYPGTFPSRRAAFAADNCTDMRFENLTIMNTLKGQAEGLLLMGERNYLKNVRIIGSGDALQTNGSAYFESCHIEGDGDTVLGRGPAFFKDCVLSSYGPFMWIRNTATNHGNVFLNCIFLGQGVNAVFARSPINRGAGYPYAEAVLINCKTENIKSVGWGEIGGKTDNIHFWEFNTRTIFDTPVDVSKRHPLSRQLYMDKDAEIIKNYSNPEYILGWNPYD